MPSLQAPVFARIPRDADGPVFAQPWQAQAFALAVRLAAAGCFTWAEWADALGEQFQAAAARGEPDDGSRYYEHWLNALEQLVTHKGWASAEALSGRRAAWIAAYRATPHGHPVELRAAARG
jgi:nitrile hydratase accessory protein